VYRQLFDKESHEHNLETLALLEQYTSFMESVGTVLDVGSGNGYDLNWWATRTVEDDTGQDIPLNIKCTGIDIKNQFDKNAFDHLNITTVEDNMEDSKLQHNSFDVIHAQNILHHAINPLATLGHWWDLARDNAMLIVTVPESTTIERTKVIADQYSNEYYHWSLVSLIHMLAVNGWDCRDAFFKKERNNPWIHAVVYKKPKFEKLDYRTTTWFDLAELNMLPESAVESLNQWNFVRQQDLQVQWLNKRVYDFRNY
jgi:ubiquinone/menaquinone biosynthesis C-methylase UbiE